MTSWLAMVNQLLQLRRQRERHNYNARLRLCRFRQLIWKFCRWHIGQRIDAAAVGANHAPVQVSARTFAGVTHPAQHVCRRYIVANSHVHTAQVPVLMSMTAATPDLYVNAVTVRVMRTRDNDPAGFDIQYRHPVWRDNVNTLWPAWNPCVMCPSTGSSVCAVPSRQKQAKKQIQTRRQAAP